MEMLAFAKATASDGGAGGSRTLLPLCLSNNAFRIIFLSVNRIVHHNYFKQQPKHNKLRNFAVEK